jgi:hypothetical protein
LVDVLPPFCVYSTHTHNKLTHKQSLTTTTTTTNN